MIIVSIQTHASDSRYDHNYQYIKICPPPSFPDRSKGMTSIKTGHIRWLMKANSRENLDIKHALSLIYYIITEKRHTLKSGHKCFPY